MKTIFVAIAALLLNLDSAPAAPPKLPIDQALKLAQDHLNGRGLAGQHSITGVTLEESSLFHGESYWFVRWSPAIQVDNKLETGLQINMDGSLARLTTGGPNRKLQLGPRNNR